MVCAALRRDFEAPLAAEVDQLLAEAGVPKRRQPRARAVILRERLGPSPVNCGWLLRLPPGASFWHQVCQARLLATWSQGRLAIGAGGLRKQRLLYGTLRLEPEEIRHQGFWPAPRARHRGRSGGSTCPSGGFLGLVAALEIPSRPRSWVPVPEVAGMPSYCSHG